MLFSELVKKCASGRHITDEGFGRCRDDGTQLRDLCKELRGCLLEFQAFRRELRQLGVTANEVSVFDCAERAKHDCVEFTAADPTTESVAKLAFATGFYYGYMSPKLVSLMQGYADRPRNVKRGVLGGNAKTGARVKKYAGIRHAFARWAEDPQNIAAKDSAFVSDFLAHRKQGQRKGFSRPTIKRAISSLYDEIRTARVTVALRPAKGESPDRVVAEHLRGSPGVTLAVVRRALS